MLNLKTDWPIKKLRDLITANPQYGANASAVEFDPNLPRYIRITDITDNGKLSDKKPKSIRETDAENYMLKSGDFLFARSGATVGKTYLHQNGSDSRLAFAGYLIRFRFDDSKLLPGFLGQYTKTSRYWYWVQSMIRAGAQPNINAQEYSSLEIPLPSIKEQKKILEILTIWDSAIEKEELVIATKEEAKKGFMQHFLSGKKRLQGFSMPWRKFHLGDLFKERSERSNDHLSLLSITREEGVIPREDVGRRDTSNVDKSKYLRICPGDIGYNTMRMWQGVSALSSYEGIISPAYTIVTPKKGADGEFMAYLFKLPKTIHLFYRYSQGLTSDTWNLKYRHFREIKVSIPEMDEQKAIAQFLKTCDAELYLLRSKLVALKKQKCGLMQKLITDQGRVKVLEEVM